MLENQKVRLRVISKMIDPQGETWESKNARKGTLCQTPDGLVLEYDDEQEGERAHIVLTMKPGRMLGENRAKMQRKGMTSGLLTFVPGARTSSSYVTMYGEIPIQIHTRAVAIESGEGGGRLMLDYDVYMGGERTSSAKMDVAWRL